LSTTVVKATAGPRYCTPRTERETYGGEVAKLARLLGFEPMAHQEMFWNIALEHEDGVLVYREIIWTIARQCGKTAALFCLALWRCLRWPGQVVRYGAQTGMDARAMLSDTWWPRLEHSPLSEVLSFRRQSGHEALMFENGSRLGLLASTEKSAHGSTLDLAVLDESWAHADHRLEQSCRPAMVTRANAQMHIVSTAGTEQRSPFLWEKVQTGRQAAEAGVTEGIAYLEWSAPPDADPGDPQSWREAIPAMGTTIDEATVRGDFQGMPRHEFQRSFLNQWTTAMGDSVIPLERWEALSEPGAPRPAEVVLAVDIAPRSVSAAIAAAGIHDGRLIVSVLEAGGTDWVAGRLQARLQELGASEVVLDARACAAIMPEIDHLHPLEVDATGITEACAFFVDLVGRDRLRHRGERELAVAIDGAAQRPLGDQWAWSRKRSGCDISPLVAVTLAAWAWRWEDCWGSDESRS
jgi:Terminase large subunit, T4likevirus-type, N-terminal